MPASPMSKGRLARRSACDRWRPVRCELHCREVELAASFSSQGVIGCEWLKTRRQYSVSVDVRQRQSASLDALTNRAYYRGLRRGELR